MSRLQIEAELRSGLGKGSARQSRLRGKVPAVIYGSGLENLHIEVSPFAVEKILKSGSGKTELIDITVGERGSFEVMIKEYQAEPVNRKLRHIDFFKVDLTKKVDVEVPLIFKGKAVGQNEGGLVDHLLRSVHVKALPHNIPDHIDIDVTPLNLGDNLHVSDIQLPEGIEMVTSLDATVVAVVEPRAEEESTAETEEVEAASDEGSTES